MKRAAACFLFLSLVPSLPLSEGQAAVFTTWNEEHAGIKSTMLSETTGTGTMTGAPPPPPRPAQRAGCGGGLLAWLPAQLLPAQNKFVREIGSGGSRIGDQLQKTRIWANQ